VRAWPQILSLHPEARLIFLGTRYPNPVVPIHKMARDTIDLAKKIGEKDLSIHFVEWLSYQDHQALLGESDLGVTFQPEHIETHFSIRTRVIDYFWARLPVVLSEGDVTAEWVSRYKVGRVVPVFDVNAVAQAINEMLDTPKESYLPAFEAMQDQFAWDNIVKPLTNYCLYGDYAADRVRHRDFSFTQGSPVISGGRPTNPFARARQIAREEGLLAMFRRGARHAVWLLTKS
jgi:hypothetical protein